MTTTGTAARVGGIRIAQIIFACLAIILPIKIALTLDQSNFRDQLNPVWWGLYLVLIVTCFVARTWSEQGFPRLMLFAGAFAILNGLLFLLAPVPGKSVYWELWQILAPGDPSEPRKGQHSMHAPRGGETLPRLFAGPPPAQVPRMPIPLRQEVG